MPANGCEYDIVAGDLRRVHLKTMPYAEGIRKRGFFPFYHSKQISTL